MTEGQEGDVSKDADDVSKDALEAISETLDMTAEALAEVLGPDRAAMAFVFAAAHLARCNGIGFGEFERWAASTEVLFEATKRRTQ
jgi:hypothetical protein